MSMMPFKGWGWLDTRPVQVIAHGIENGRSCWSVLLPNGMPAIARAGDIKIVVHDDAEDNYLAEEAYLAWTAEHAAIAKERGLDVDDEDDDDGDTPAPVPAGWPPSSKEG